MERGRSLSELGRSMRWSDLRAFIGFLPASSHFRCEEEPEQARALAWLEGLSTPQAALLGDLVDLIEADILLRAGQNPSDRTAIQRLAQRATAGKNQHAQVESKPKGKKRKTPDEIRAQLGLKKPANN